jgi:hypothetical protein
MVSTVGEICKSEAVSWKVARTPKVKKRKDKPLSLLDHMDANDPNKPPSPLFTGKVRLDTSPVLGDFNLSASSYNLYEDHPLPTRKRQRRVSDSPRSKKKLAKNSHHPPSPLTHNAFSSVPSPLTYRAPSPLHYTPSTLAHHALAPLAHHTPSSVEFESPLSLDLFDSPAPDFFGFSRSQESFSDVTSRKLFSEDFI